MQRWMNKMQLIGRQPVTSQSHPTLPSAEIPSHDGIRRVELELAHQPAYVCNGITAKAERAVIYRRAKMKRQHFQK